MIDYLLDVLWREYEQANLLARVRYYEQRDSVDSRYNLKRRRIES